MVSNLEGIETNNKFARRNNKSNITQLIFLSIIAICLVGIITFSTKIHKVTSPHKSEHKATISTVRLPILVKENKPANTTIPEVVEPVQLVEVSDESR